MSKYLVVVDERSGRSQVGVHQGMINSLDEALELTAQHDNCQIIAFEANNSNQTLNIQLRLTPAEQESYDWLIDQGGLVEMADADEFATNWWHLERKLWIKRVAPDGCSRMYWELAD